MNSDLQEASRPGAPGSERILLDILEHDWREAQDSRQELCQKLHAVQGELQWAEELRDKVVSSTPPPLLPALAPAPISWGRKCQASRVPFSGLPCISAGLVLRPFVRRY